MDPCAIKIFEVGPKIGLEELLFSQWYQIIAFLFLLKKIPSMVNLKLMV